MNDTVLRHDIGDLAIHCGQLLHAGEQITDGVRYIMTGFMSVSSPMLDQDAIVESKNSRVASSDIPDAFYLDGLFSKFGERRG